MTVNVTLNSLASVLPWLVRAGWQAAILAFLVLLLCAVLGKRLEARWRYGLWLLVLLRLAIPITPAAPWSLFGLMPTNGEDAHVTHATAPVSLTEHAPTASARALVRPDISRSTMENVPSTPEPSVPEGLTTPPWFALVWLGVAALLLARHARLRIGLRRRSQAWRPVVDENVLQVIQRCRAELDIVRSVSLLQSAAGCGPATCGVFGATIVVPEKLLAAISTEELRLVMLHELAHVKRWDVLMDRVASCLAVIHWFNPVAWLARASLRRERELACDAVVMAHLVGRNAEPYGRVLLKVAESLGVESQRAEVVGIFGRKDALYRRIRMIAENRKATVTEKIGGGVLFLLMGCIGLTDAVSQQPAPGAASPVAEQAPPAKGEKTVTIAGVCTDEDAKPLAGVQVVLYREDGVTRKAERLQSIVSSENGKFEFPKLPALPRVKDNKSWYSLVLNKPGYGSIVYAWSMVYTNVDQNLDAPLNFKLRPAATLQGRVTDASGKPIAGARVWGGALYYGPVDGICSALTDAEGRYAIKDMAKWPANAREPLPGPNGGFTVLSGCYFDVSHPDYAHTRPLYKNMPDTVDVVLVRGGAIEGVVLDQVTNKPASGVFVAVQGTREMKQVGGEPRVRTDANGKYRLGSMLPGTYNVKAFATDRTCVALDSFKVESGKTHEAPDLVLIEGGWIEGRLVNAANGRPFSGLQTHGRLHVASYGPADPRSGAGVATCEVDDKGFFRLRVAPGLNFPYIMSGEWQRTQKQEYYEKGIEVKSGEIVSLEFRILPDLPIPDPDPAPVRSPVPIPSERQAAERIRELGGWYELNADRQVIEVNMVFYDTPSGRRFDNDRVTDEALRTVAAFPKLKRLYLHKTQATDDALRSLKSLTELETLFVWSATAVTDAGIHNLEGLKNLKKLHFSNGKIGDGALAVFGKLPELTNLSLQGNNFSDDGLKHLAGLKKLQSLWIGNGRQPFTDAGVKHLSGLTGLRELDLQGSALSDEGVASLKDLKELRKLFIQGKTKTSISDASVEHLLALTKLQELWITTTGLSQEGAKRLTTLPELKTFERTGTDLRN